MPRPSDAQIAPSAPCVPVRQGKLPGVCAFGVPSWQADDTFALVGDSHAVHWRAALEVLARAKRWRGLTVYRTRCPFTRGIPNRPEPDRSACVRWNGEVLRWFEEHPEVSTVFVSQRVSTGVVAAPGQSASEAKRAGYIDAWNALPETVKRVVVIRDVPYNKRKTLSCIERALTARRPAGPACAVPRRVALRPDPALAAAAQMRSPRVQPVDLTPFMCSRSRCYPVIGGALVHKDIGHLTRVFAATLGPFLLREVKIAK